MEINMKNMTSITKNNLWQASRNQQGFTLIEILVSMVILTVGIFGLIKTADSVIFYQNSARLTTEATMKTTNKIEEIKRLSTEEPTGGTFGFNYLVTTYVEDPAVWAVISNKIYRRIETDGDFTITTDLQTYPSTSSDSFDNPLSILMLEVLVKTEWTDSRNNQKDLEMASVLHRRQFVGGGD